MLSLPRIYKGQAQSEKSQGAEEPQESEKVGEQLDDAASKVENGDVTSAAPILEPSQEGSGAMDAVTAT